MFRMYGRTVQVLHYQVNYTQNEREETVYAATEQEAQETARLLGGTVTALETEDDAWMDGIEVKDVSDTYAEAMRIYQTHLNGLQYAKNIKIKQLSEACNATINAGAEIQLAEDVVESFSYTLADQANVSEMFTAVMAGATEYPYHQNGGDCKMYSAQDIIKIYSTLSGMKTGQITYQNQLKQYVKAMTNIEDVYEVSYGQELTGEYLEKYNTLIAQAQEQMQTVLSKMMG